MKTTIDLPEALLRELQLRADRDEKMLSDVVSDLLRKELAKLPETKSPENSFRTSSPRIKTDPQTGLPLIVCDPDAPARRMTVEQLLKLEQPPD